MSPTCTGAEAALSRLGTKVDLLLELARERGADDDPRWSQAAVVGDERLGAAWVLRHAVRDLTHHLSDAGRGLHCSAPVPPPQEGTVVQLNASDGGVPRSRSRWPRSVTVASSGTARPTVATTAARCRRWRIWSADVIGALRAEGHPIQPGAAGENITVSGIDWPTLRTGVQRARRRRAVRCRPTPPPAARARRGSPTATSTAWTTTATPGGAASTPGSASPARSAPATRSSSSPRTARRGLGC